MESATFNDVPEDLLLKIFLLLPMFSLVLSRNVCKLWDQIIGSEYFNGFRLARERTSSNSNKYLLLEGFRDSKSTSLVDSDKHIYHDIPIRNNYECYGICDGLLCLASTKDCSDANASIILWNPIFRKTLPPLDVKYSQITYICFGYHDDDYKVIKVVVFPRLYYVCIYSLSTNSWNVLKFAGLISGIQDYDYYKSHSWGLQYSKGRLVDGVAYFAGDQRIISFDLSSEMFRKPVFFVFRWDTIMEACNDSLVLLGCTSTGIMDEYQMVRDLFVAMWVPKASDDSSDNFYAGYKNEMLLMEVKDNHKFQPVGFLNKDELVIRTTPLTKIRKYSFLLYSMGNQCVRKFTSQETYAAMVQSSSNVDSFIRVGGMKDEVSEYIKPIHAPVWKPKKKAASTSNSYAALADSGDDLLD